jgi:hypothetical protein
MLLDWTGRLLLGCPGPFACRHYDGGSVITLVCCMNERGKDFEGGMFRTNEPDGSTLLHPQMPGDVALFLSHKCVEVLTFSHRFTSRFGLFVAWVCGLCSLCCSLTWCSKLTHVCHKTLHSV